ncbi:MAG: response regulator [Parachlamydiaceae bacterium]
MGKELKKILYVDDEEDIHVIVRFCLEELPNLELRSVYSGEEAIKTAIEFQPDLILLDVMMPNMDGISTFQALKLMPSFAHVPIVFLTAKAQKNEIEEYFKYGAIDVILKPFDTNTFTQNVQSIWRRYQQQRV